MGMHGNQAAERHKQISADLAVNYSGLICDISRPVGVYIKRQMALQSRLVMAQSWAAFNCVFIACTAPALINHNVAVRCRAGAIASAQTASWLLASRAVVLCPLTFDTSVVLSQTWRPFPGRLSDYRVNTEYGGDLPNTHTHKKTMVVILIANLRSSQYPKLLLKIFILNQTLAAIVQLCNAVELICVISI